MGEVYEHFQKISELLGDRIQGIIMDPVFWITLLLLLCCIVLAYNGTSQGRLSGSIVNTVRQLGTFFIDTFNSIIQACRSLFGFLDVLKLLFFGHLGHSTLYVLTNYAIIFLSIASFTTTMNGLFSLIGWTGLLISFGVQVMELIAAMGLIICWVPPRGKLKETVIYRYCGARTANPCKEPGTVTTSRQENGSRTGWFRWGWVRRVMLPLLLAISYAASVTFSYCYIFNEVVMPEIAYDDYMESIDLVITNTELFEQELTTYRSELVRELSKLNGDVTTSNSFAERSYSTLENRVQALESDLDRAERAAAGLLENMQQVGQDDPNYPELQEAYRAELERRDSINAQLLELETTRGSDGYAVFTAIQLLEQYYADPLYLMRSEAGTENAVNEVMNAFSIVMEQGVGQVQMDIGVYTDSARVAFNNYTNLCRYYAEQGGTGLDLTAAAEGEASLEDLLSRRAEVLSEYSRLKSQTQDDGSEDPAAALKSAGGYLNGETGNLLIAAMQVLESVPQFPTVGPLWPGAEAESSAPQEPRVSAYLSQLNEKYRASNGQLSLQERAYTKLTSPNPTTARFCFIMACALDGMIIALCCLRGREYYANNVRNRRQMIALLFVNPLTEEEKENNERSRRRILAGAVLGCFAYLLYFRLLPGGGNGSAIMAPVLVVCGVLLLALLGAFRDMFHKKAEEQGKDGEEAPSPLRERLAPPVYALFSEDLRCGHFWKKCYVRRPRPSAVWGGVDYYLAEKRIWKQKEDHRIRTHVLGCGDYDEVVTTRRKSTEFYVPEKKVRERGLTLPFSILLSFGLAYRVRTPCDVDACAGQEDTEAGAEPAVEAQPSAAGEAGAAPAVEAQMPAAGETGAEPAVEAQPPAAGETGAEPAVEAQTPAAGEAAEESETREPAYILTEDFLRLLYECVMLRALTGNNWDYGMEDDLLDYEREEDDEED